MATIRKLLLCMFLGQTFAWAASYPEPARDRTYGGELLISAAASLRDIMGAITPHFERANPGIKLTFNYGASGQLEMQIESGAPVDVFISAAVSDMDALEKKGWIDPSTRQNVAANALVLIRNRSWGPVFKSMEDLVKGSISRVAIGNPATVPAGRYAREALESGNLYDRLKDKLVLAENVRQVLDYVARGEADAGFVYRTDAMAESKVEAVGTIPGNRHTPILYPAAVLATSNRANDAKQFVAYLCSGEARGIFRKYGFE